MSFQTTEVIKSSYKKYGISKGFGIKTHNSKKESNEKIRYII